MTSKVTPFDWINSIQHNKTDMMTDEYMEKSYNSFIINRGLSFGADTVIYANEMNSRPHLDKKMQYDFLLQAIPAKKRYNKWIKAEAVDNLDIVKEYFGYSDEKAKQALDILTPDNLEEIKQLLFKGGLNNAK
jgi:hypothetical protein